MKSDREKGLEMLEKVQRDFRDAMALMKDDQSAYAMLVGVQGELDRAIRVLKAG